jgi:hypothetical protein
VSCPFDCEYLQEARKHESMPSLAGVEVPNKDIRMTESELREHEDLLMFVAATILQTALQTPGVVDLDVRAALDALIRTYRTLQSGIYYETRPENPLAGGISAAVRNAIEEFRAKERDRLGSTRTRDSDVLKILVFLQHIELDRNNGRRRGRAFLDALRGFYPSPSTPSLILP